MVFEADPPSGKKLTYDTVHDADEESQGPSPMEVLLATVGACSAMDVISILEKKRQTVTDYRIEVEGTRQPPGEWPRPFEKITLRHIVVGENVDPAAVERAVELSDSKYCSVVATLRSTPEIVSEWVVEAAQEALPK